MDNAHCSGGPQSNQAADLASEEESAPLPPAPADASGDGRIHSSGWTPGKLVARHYVVVSRLGHGGMAEVYLLRDSRTGDFVAAKRPIGPFVQTKALREQFISEANAWTRLSAHPNIVSAFDAREVDYFPCILMEYVDGGTLLDIIRISPGGAGNEDSLRIALQVCWALEFSHNQGLMHLDLKPTNILLTSAGDAKVTDFGLAASLAGTCSAESANMSRPAVGTWAYMAPEQWEGVVTRAVDVYAFGVTLYLLFTGRHPFAHRITEEATHFGCGRLAAEFYRHLHQNAEPQDPLLVRSEIDGAVRDLLLACLEKDPANRLQEFGPIADVLLSRCGRTSLAKPTEVELSDRQQIARAWALVRVGIGAQTRDDADLAVEQFSEAERLFRAMKDVVGLATCHNMMGSILHGRSEFTQALRAYQNSLDLADGDDSWATAANAWLGLGATHRALGDLDQALHAYARSHDLFTRVQDPLGVAKSKQGQGVVLRDLRKLPEALATQEDALRAYTALEDSLNSAVVRNNIGEILQEMGQYEEALDYLQEALPELERLGSRYYAALCYLNTGEVRLKLGDAKQALEWYARSAETFEELGCRHYLAECLVYKAEAYESLAQWSSALAAYRRAEDLKRALGIEIPSHITDKIRTLGEELD